MLDAVSGGQVDLAIGAITTTAAVKRQDYAFALPTNSALREAINASLLRRINSPDWDKRLAKYFGSND